MCDTSPSSYALDPVLPKAAGVFHTPPDSAVFSAFADSAPDRWGENLMRREERERARAAAATPRTLGKADFLLGVRDDTRQGAIRFRRPRSGSYYSAHRNAVPRLIEVARLLRAAERLEAEGIASPEGDTRNSEPSRPVPPRRPSLSGGLWFRTIRGLCETRFRTCRPTMADPDGGAPPASRIIPANRTPTVPRRKMVDICTPNSVHKYPLSSKSRPNVRMPPVASRDLSEMRLLSAPRQTSRAVHGPCA
jgi:hypothetical protein